MRRPGPLCEVCSVTLAPFLDPFRELAAKLDELADDPARLAELERVTEAGIRMARSFDCLICDECRKLGPPFPF